MLLTPGLRTRVGTTPYYANLPLTLSSPVPSHPYPVPG